MIIFCDIKEIFDVQKRFMVTFFYHRESFSLSFPSGTLWNWIKRVNYRLGCPILIFLFLKFFLLPTACFLHNFIGELKFLSESKQVLLFYIVETACFYSWLVPVNRCFWCFMHNFYPPPCSQGDRNRLKRFALIQNTTDTNFELC